MPGDAQQPALGRRVHRQVEHHAPYLTINHPLDWPLAFSSTSMSPLPTKAIATG